MTVSGLFDFETIVGDAADAVRAMLADRLLRVSLQGDDTLGTEQELVARWCLPSASRHAARLRGSGRIVGAISREDGTLSYFIARPEWRQGYGTALVEQYLRQTFWPAAPLQARVARGNLASRRILQRLGFAERGLEWRDRCLAPAVVYLESK
jgi:GNAT superfamily N-acetyltransferase